MILFMMMIIIIMMMVMMSMIFTAVMMIRIFCDDLREIWQQSTRKSLKYDTLLIIIIIIDNDHDYLDDDHGLMTMIIMNTFVTMMIGSRA